MAYITDAEKKIEREEALRMGILIQEFRCRANISQEDFAEQIGISRQFVSEIERGLKLPRLTKLLRMFTVLGIEPNELFSDKYLSTIAPSLSPDFKQAIHQSLTASKEQQELITLLINLALK